MDNDEKKLEWLLLFFSWLVAMVATLGSLFFSEIMDFIPCTLCWYQRIFMYPLVLILLVGMMPYDKKVLKFATPLVAIGWLFAMYHNLIHYEVVPESASPCVQGIPCSTKYIEWFGFITIPMLSLIAFSMIAVLFIIIKKKG